VGAKALGEVSDSNHALHIECHHATYNPHPGAHPDGVVHADDEEYPGEQNLHDTIVGMAGKL